MTDFGFFPGCAYKSAAGYRQSVEALNACLGIGWKELADWNCCGATAAFSLDEDDGLALCARLFALAQNQGVAPIVTVCNACYTTLRKAKKRLEKDPQALATATHTLAAQGLELAGPLPDVRHYLDLLATDYTDVLQNRISMDAFRWGPVAVYYGCQYSRPWLTGAYAQRPRVLENLFAKIKVPYVEHSAGTQCCGASHAVPYADACGAMIRRIVREIRSKGGATITTICPLCQFNLDAGQTEGLAAPIPVTYFTQIIGLALGILPKSLGLNKLLIPLHVEGKKAS